jgi:hypothetical protein
LVGPQCRDQRVPVERRHIHRARGSPWVTTGPCSVR